MTTIKLTPRQAVDFFTALDIAAETTRNDAHAAAGCDYARLKDDIERYEELMALLRGAFPEAIKPEW